MRFVCIEEGNRFLVYRDGLYHDDAENRILEWIEARHREKGMTAKIGFCHEVIASIQRSCFTRLKQVNPPGRLCLLNGILELEPIHLRDHTPNVAFTTQLPVQYDPAAKCPTWDKFLAQAVPGEKERSVLQEFIGYLFVRGYPHQVALILYGPAGSGKSTFLATVVVLLGRDNVSAEPLQTIIDNRFSAVKLVGKLANVCADLSDRAIVDDSRFKMLTGGDEVVAEEKYHPRFSFLNSAKLLFSVNELPEVKHPTDAFFRRWLIIQFPNALLPDDQDPTLPGRLAPEAPGILNWALEGYARLNKRGHFERVQSIEDVATEWVYRSNSVRWFAAERLDLTDPDARTAKSDVYEAFSFFCFENDLDVLSDQEFARQFRIKFKVRDVRPSGQDGDRVRFWQGVRLR